MAQSMVIPVIPTLASTFSVVPGMAAQVITAQLLGRVICGLPAGIFVDRFGTRVSLVVGSGVLAASALVAAFAPSFPVLLISMFVAGAGGSLWLLARELATIDLVAQDQRGRAMSGIFGLTNTGTAMGPVLGGFMTTFLDFRSVFFAGFALAAISILLGLTVREGAARRAAPGKFTFALTRLDALPEQFRVTYVVLMFGTFAAFVRMMAINSLLPLLMVTQLGYTEAELGVQFGVIGFITLMMIGPAGYVSDHWGRKAPSVFAALLSIVLSIGYGVATDTLSLTILSVIVGVTTGFGLGAMTTYTYDIVPTQMRGQFQSFRRAAGEAGALVGPSIGGLVATLTMPSVALAVFLPLHVVSTLLLMFLAKETLQRRTAKVPGG